MIIKSEDGLQFEAIDHNGKCHAIMVFNSIDYHYAELMANQTFILSKLSQHVWVTVFKDNEINKLIASIKIDDQNVFTINTFYGRNKYFVMNDRHTENIKITDDKKFVLACLFKTKGQFDKSTKFEIEEKSKYNLGGDWFLLLHAVHCALYLTKLSDNSFY